MVRRHHVHFHLARMGLPRDGYRRLFAELVGWSVADHMREELVVDALTMAVRNRILVGEVVFHSDRGSQYTGRAFRDACLSNGIIPSVGKTGICFDNAAAESWNATFKKELIHLHVWKDLAHVRQAPSSISRCTTTVSGYRKRWGICHHPNSSSELT